MPKLNSQGFVPIVITIGVVLLALGIIVGLYFTFRKLQTYTSEIPQASVNTSALPSHVSSIYVNSTPILSPSPSPTSSPTPSPLSSTPSPSPTPTNTPQSTNTPSPSPTPLSSPSSSPTS